MAHKREQYEARTIAGHAARFYEVLESTNTTLKQLAREGAAHGLIITADAQTRGRGRLDREWLARPGAGAWFSCLVRPKAGAVLAREAPGLAFVAALSTARALRDMTGADIRVKWPNDLVLNGGKLVGILCETRADGDYMDWAVIGIGVNLRDCGFPPEMPWAASVEGKTGIILRPEDVIARIIEDFDERYGAWLREGLAPILEELARISATLGSRVCARSNDAEIVGDAVRFAPDGALIIAVDGEELALRAGDVSVRGLMGYA